MYNDLRKRGPQGVEMDGGGNGSEQDDEDEDTPSVQPNVQPRDPPAAPRAVRVNTVVTHDRGPVPTKFVASLEHVRL